MVSSVRRRVVRDRYNRRCRSGDPEYGIKRLLLRNLEDLSLEQFQKLLDVLTGDPAVDELATAWIAKELLRKILGLRITRSHVGPTSGQFSQRWYKLMSWCADNDQIPELTSFAKTLDAWRQQIANAVLLGVSNAGSEAVNRIQKLDMRVAFGYRNPENQRRRALIASRRCALRSSGARYRQRLWMNGPVSDPG
jgi:transposase